ncbi:LysM peptidoglycan-binding domain-containing protein [Anaeromicropila herbilytica]|nr:LysM peptidoglycan-binding domain-containing protein [Anaeromicropila herbilytica]
MIIYVVQVGDTITSIANKYGVSEARIIQENGLHNPTDLVIGQTIVITYPQKIYVVKEGDTLSDIALNQGISIMQLYRNNPFLWEREYIYPGEELVISYNTLATITTNAYAFPYVNMNVLKKALPNLTYLSILNYKTLKKGEIESFYDDTELIKTAKQYGVAPVMLVTSITFQGVRNPEMIYEILLNPEYQDNHAQNMIKVMKEKGYYGVNITITFLSKATEQLYINYLKRVTAHFHKEGYPVFVTIDPNFTIKENKLYFEEVDYSFFNDLVEEVYIMRFFWGTQYVPPMPVSSVANISLYVDYMKQMIDPKKINVGFPLLGYDWTLPYVEGYSEGNAITLDSALDLARLMESTIQFDEISETPNYEYNNNLGESIIEHIVWFVDARTIYGIVNLVIENNLRGNGLWNIMNYNPQLWLITNSNCIIEKVLPEMG